MASSKVQICNLAISWLAGNPITSLETDPSLEARLCNTNYDESRKSVLEEREWTFAVGRDTLTLLDEKPEFGFLYTLMLPADCLRTITVRDPGRATLNQARVLPHRVEKRRIYADLPSVHLRYMVDVTDVTKFPALFTQALAAHIAKNIVMPLTSSKDMFENMNTVYENNLHKAISSDSLQGSREMLDTSTMEEVRRLYVRPR